MLPPAYVERILAHHAAPCLAGIKPANLVSFAGTDPHWCTAYNAVCNASDVYFTPLCICRQRTLVLVYRKRLLTGSFFTRNVANILQSFGYNPEKGVEVCIEKLKERIIACKTSGYEKAAFPHEIGFFLGYPFDDVLQYIKREGKECLFCGYWKVYSNPEYAKKIFRRYTECKEHFALQIKNGMSISEIIHAA